MRAPWQALSFKQRQFWKDQGYLILPGLFNPEEIEAVNDLVQRIRQNPKLHGNATVDVLHGEHIGKRFRGVDAPVEVFAGPIKINDLFFQAPEVQRLAADKRLTKILAELLGGAPLVCNSLNFIWGSQQPDHFDTWYMPPRVENKMVVSSICLEDVQPDAGPLAYYPGSQKIAPYRFSHGGIHAVAEEIPACRCYVEEQLKKMHAERHEYLGKAGDVFLWHGQLLHGGTGITDLKHTRKTLVTHYWRVKDVQPEEVVRINRYGRYLKRPL
jgi:ectoine hydroxylase-related dioxygenase (phytanoyl-CoA dioxygenase family)